MGPNLFNFFFLLKLVRIIDLHVNDVHFRKIGASKELSRKEREAEERDNDIGGAGDDDDQEMDM